MEIIMVKKTIHTKAFTIVELMIAIGVFFIAFVGTSAYRYGAAMDAHKADLQTKATQTAMMFCEAWNGMGGSTGFKPIARFSSDITISASIGPSIPTGFTWMGSYKVQLESTEYFVTLSWKNINSDLRALSVIVNWDPTGLNTGSFIDAKKSYWLTTYVENPI